VSVIDEQWVWRIGGKQGSSEKNLSQRHFVHRKSTRTDLRLNMTHRSYRQRTAAYDMSWTNTLRVSGTRYEYVKGSETQYAKE
jgi:hypothetical protein